MVPRSVAPTLPRNLLEIQILGSYFRATELESLAVSPVLFFKKLSK